MSPLLTANDAYRTESTQLLELWREARVAGNVARYERLSWAAREWDKTHPGQKTAAYKLLDRITRGDRV